MQKSVDRAESLTTEELVALRKELVEEPVVRAIEVARFLGCHKSGVSRFLSGEASRLPGGAGPNTFRDAVRRIRARKVAEGAAA